MGREKDTAPTIGDNSGLTADEKFKLSGYIDEIVRVELQKRELTTDIKEIYSSAKDSKFSTKAIRHLVRRRLMDDEKVAGLKAFEHILDVYMMALGDYASTPLGRAAMPRQDAHA